MAVESTEELEPLFDYSRVQPIDSFSFDDDELEPFPILTGGKRKRISGPEDGEVEESRKVVVVSEKNNDGNEQQEEDWMPSPPPYVPRIGFGLIEDNFLQEIRRKKQELVSFAQSTEDMLKAVMESANKQFHSTSETVLESMGEQPPKHSERTKIIICILDKDGQKQFRMYKDDKFERLFRMYAERVHLSLESVVFCFDGDKVSPTATPEGLGLENDDMIEVHVKSH